MTGCLHVLVLHRSDMNLLEVLWVAVVGKVHMFTDNVSREMYPTACSGLQLARYSQVQGLLWSLHPWSDFQENSVHQDAGSVVLQKDPLETWPVFGCSEGLSWKSGPNNHGEHWKNYFCLTWSMTFAGAASSDLAVSSRPVLCKVIMKTQVSLFLSSRDAGVPCTELYQNQEVPALNPLNFQSCLET